MEYFDYDTQTSDISHRYRIMLSALIMGHVCRRFAEGARPLTADELRRCTSIPIRIVNDLLYKLIEARLLVELSSDEKGESSRYMPAESLQNLSLGVMIDRLEAQGRWQIDLPVSRLFSSSWVRGVEARMNYLRQMRDVRLEDLPA